MNIYQIYLIDLGYTVKSKFIQATEENATRFFEQFKKRHAGWSMMRVDPTVITSDTIDSYRDAITRLEAINNEVKLLENERRELTKFVDDVRLPIFSE